MRLVAFLTLIAVGVAFACYEGTYESVHFYSYNLMDPSDKKPIDFGRLPQKVMVPNWNYELVRSGTDYDAWTAPDDYHAYDENYDVVLHPGLERARNLEAAGRYAQALRAYRTLDLGRAYRSFVQERSEVFAMARRRRQVRGLSEYLRATYLIRFYDEPGGKGGSQGWTPGEAALRAIRPGNELLPFVDYDRLDFEDFKTRDEARLAYLGIHDQYPSSPRAEPALVMAARAMLNEESAVPTPDDIGKGKELLLRVIREYPRTRFKANIQGWLAYCAEHKGDDLSAVALYTRQASSNDPAEAWKGHTELARICRRDGKTAKGVAHLLQSWLVRATTYSHLQAGQALRATFASLKERELSEVQALVRKDPELLAAYLGFRIEDTRLEPKEGQALGKFALRAASSMRRRPAAMLARVAQAAYNAGLYSQSLKFARLAVRVRTDREAVQQGLYVSAASEARLGTYRQAICDYERLFALHPREYLMKPCAENLALLCERHGNPLRALDLYRWLSSDMDVAYMADVELSPSQLRRYVRQLRPGQERNVLTYTLGMRYFRLGQFRAAAQVFATLPRKVREHGGMDKKEFESIVSDMYYEQPYRYADPLIDVRDLAGLQRRVDLARGPEAKSQALYDMAQFIYKRRNLLYYSPGLWKGSRAFDFDFYWSAHVNTKAEDERVWRYYELHECLNHSMNLCDRIIKEFPHSSVLPKALYTGALSAERLSNLNERWRDRGGPLIGKAISYMLRIARDYPKDPLANDAKKYAGEFDSDLKTGN